MGFIEMKNPCIWYHGTTPEAWNLIQSEGVLWGRPNKGSRVTWLSNEISSCKGPPECEVILRVEYDPTGRRDDCGPLNNYNPDSWQIRVYEPIPIDCCERVEE